LSAVANHCLQWVWGNRSAHDLAVIRAALLAAGDDALSSTTEPQAIRCRHDKVYTKEVLPLLEGLHQHNTLPPAFEAVELTTDLPPRRLRERLVLALANSFGSNAADGRASNTAKRCLVDFCAAWVQAERTDTPDVKRCTYLALEALLGYAAGLTGNQPLAPADLLTGFTQWAKKTRRQGSSPTTGRKHQRYAAQVAGPGTGLARVLADANLVDEPVLWLAVFSKAVHLREWRAENGHSQDPAARRALLTSLQAALQDVEPGGDSTWIASVQAGLQAFAAYSAQQPPEALGCHSQGRPPKAEQALPVWQRQTAQLWGRQYRDRVVAAFERHALSSTERLLVAGVLLLPLSSPTGKAGRGTPSQTRLTPSFAEVAGCFAAALTTPQPVLTPVATGLGLTAYRLRQVAPKTSPCEQAFAELWASTAMQMSQIE